MKTQMKAVIEKQSYSIKLLLSHYTLVLPEYEVEWDECELIFFGLKQCIVLFFPLLKINAVIKGHFCYEFVVSCFYSKCTQLNVLIQIDCFCLEFIRPENS